MNQSHRTISSLILLLAIFTMAKTYSLDGEWVLSNHKDVNLSQSTNVQFQFIDTIGPNSTIIKNMFISACYDLSFKIEIQENSLYILEEKIIGIPRKCQPGQMQAIRRNINKIFQFAINGTQLMLNGPKGEKIFILEKKVLLQESINGQWLSINSNRNQINQDIYINGSHAILCNGNGIVSYKASKKNQITFSVIRSRGCSKDQLNILEAFDSAQFYRIRNQSYLYLYDRNLNTILYSFYTNVYPFYAEISFTAPRIIRSSNQSRENINQTSSNNTIKEINETKQTILIKGDINLTKTANNTVVNSNNNTINAIKQVNISKKDIIINQTNQTQQKIVIDEKKKEEIKILVDQKKNQSKPIAKIDVQNQSSNKNLSSIISVLNNLTNNKSQSIPLKVQVPKPQTPQINTTQTPKNNTVILQKPKVQNIKPQTIKISPISKQQSKPTILKSLSELLPLPSLQSLQTKWFFLRLKDKNVKDYQNYYFIINPTRLIIYGGCNVMFSNYSIQGNKITFSPAAGTRKFCPNDKDPIIVDAILKQSIYIQLRNTNINLYNNQLIETVSLTTIAPQ